MHLRSDSSHWGGVAKTFHWLIVVLIIAQGAVGLYMVDLPKKPAIIPVYNFHKSVGLTILALAVLRLAWRLFDRRPDEPPGTTRVQSLAARAGHALLYLLLFLVPLSGWWFDSVSALRPLYWFGLIEMPKLGAPDPGVPDLKDIAAGRHEFLFWLLVVVAVGHAAMALVHQFVQRDGTLARMLPGRRVPAPRPVASANLPDQPENPHVEIPPAAAEPAADVDRDNGRGA